MTDVVTFVPDKPDIPAHNLVFTCSCGKENVLYSGITSDFVLNLSPKKQSLVGINVGLQNVSFVCEECDHKVSLSLESCEVD